MDWTTLVPVAGALGGAVIGATIGFFGTSRIQRAKPGMVVTSCVSSTDFALEETVQPDETLISVFEKTPEIGRDYLYQRRWDETLENEYVQALDETERELRLQIQRLPELGRVVRELRGHVVAHRWAQFQELWADNKQYIWSPLITAFSRGTGVDLETDIDIRDELPDDVRTGDGYVTLGWATSQIVFTYAQDDPKQAEFALRAAVAIVRRNEDDIRALLNELESYTATERLQELLARVRPEIKRFNRIHVRGQFTNTGRLGYAVANAGQLHLAVKGQSIAQLDGTGQPGAAKAYEENLVIPMVVVPYAEESDDSIPVDVPAGALVPFVAVSTETIASMRFGDDIAKKLEAGGVKACLGYNVTMAGSSKIRSRFSTQFDFVSATETVEVRAGVLTRMRRKELR